MVHFDMPPQKSNIIKVLGFGGGGGNAVNHMYQQGIQNVDFIICNTDAQALQQSEVPNKIQLGPHLTSGLGAGANPEVGRQATEESLEEIRRMLEINTKMAFITAGMGGGTGTGGAPTVARICKELGILTVGIVTTPFAFEGPKRMQQAQSGINELKDHVDTLLVISNDKLRDQYGNLKMKEAFSKADNVLTTAAKCITDVINSHGQINVDFSDVCTVMRDGGVAILGSATEAGEDRAEKAIMGAINSPLLNDSDISGAKWILLNIVSSSGEHEFTMDEVETIQSFVRQQAGENSDVILGMGYDESLEDKIAITIIATGFAQKDPFSRQKPKVAQPKPEPVIEMVLGKEGDELKMFADPVPEAAKPAPVMPIMVHVEEPEAPVADVSHWMQSVDESFEDEAEADADIFELNMPEEKNSAPENVEPKLPSRPEVIYQTTDKEEELPAAEALNFTLTESGDIDKPEQPKEVAASESEDEAISGMSISFVDDQTETQPSGEGRQVDIPVDDLSEEEQGRRKALERINRLRNISFNPRSINSQEYDDVPAYQRRDLDLHNTIANVEDYYSRSQVKGDDKKDGSGIISTINNFLHGKKPD